jgi:hypothetical protein
MRFNRFSSPRLHVFGLPHDAVSAINAETD